jgi:hypothetical protein
VSGTIQRLCAWAGPAFIVSYVIAFGVIAGFIPPPDPSWTPAQVAAFYEEHRTAIRIGQVLALVFSTLLFPFFALISSRIARIERGGFSLLAQIQFGGAILLIVFFQLCSMLWIAATFRPELGAESVRMLHDLSWLVFVMVFPAYVLQMICIATAGFMDRGEYPTWPRWAAYLNLWVGMSGAGGGLAVFFKEGPFAWNGLVGFWVPVVMFASWLVVTTVLLLRAIERERADQPAGLDDLLTAGRPATAAPLSTRP